ncbi:kinesin, putative, partial [Trypanosoma cruzi]
MGNMPPSRSSNSSLSTTTTNTATTTTPTAANVMTATAAFVSSGDSQPSVLSTKVVNRAAGNNGVVKAKRLRSGSAMSDSRRTSARQEK